MVDELMPRSFIVLVLSCVIGAPFIKRRIEFTLAPPPSSVATICLSVPTREREGKEREKKKKKKKMSVSRSGKNGKVPRCDGSSVYASADRSLRMNLLFCVDARGPMSVQKLPALQV